MKKVPCKTAKVFFYMTRSKNSTFKPSAEAQSVCQVRKAFYSLRPRGGLSDRGQMVESTCLGGEHRLTRQPRVFHDAVCTVEFLSIALISLTNHVVFSFHEILNVTGFAVFLLHSFCMHFTCQPQYGSTATHFI